MEIRFPVYTEEDRKKADEEESYPDFIVFNFLHNAFFGRDPRGQPLIPLDYENLGAASEVARAFKECRVPLENGNSGGAAGRWKQNPNGATFRCSREGLDLLERHVKIFVPMFLGSGEAELGYALRDWIRRARDIQHQADLGPPA